MENSDPTINPVDGSSMADKQRVVILAGLALYEAALHIRNANGITEDEAKATLLDPINEVTRQLKRQIARSKLPIIEKPPASIIQMGEDKAADFLRAANSGANIEVAQFSDQSPQTKFDGRFGGL